MIELKLEGLCPKGLESGRSLAAEQDQCKRLKFSKFSFRFQKNTRLITREKSFDSLSFEIFWDISWLIPSLERKILTKNTKEKTIIFCQTRRTSPNSFPDSLFPIGHITWIWHGSFYNFLYVTWLSLRCQEVVTWGTVTRSILEFYWNYVNCNFLVHLKYSVCKFDESSGQC